MSILKKSYEISIWEDYWSIAENKFVEKKLCIIGTDKMMSQGRALEPTLTRCTNGTTKFSFKMYKWFIDSITGIKTENPFIQYLVAERKVKLKYDNKWYEFLIKDINEPSNSHLYTFNLEDAFVNELSKNGFSFIFDPAQQNNLGTAQELGERLLADTDWTVASEAFVQTTEEALVHLLVSNTFQATRLLDQTDLRYGIQEETAKTIIPKDAKILAFYSCCKNQPHRFQFIYVEDGKYETNEKGIIINKNCQYYIDIPEPDSEIEYVTHSMTTEGYSFVLPSVTTLYVGIKYNGKKDQKISLYARGNRYTYTQQTQYFPQIKKYLTAYTKEGVKYWSYSNTEYVAPNLITNLVSGLDFKSTSGWVGSFIGTKPDGMNVSEAKTAIETVYGYWNGSTFVNISNDWEAGTFNVDEVDKYYAALRFKPNSNTSVHGAVINSGFNDKKKIIKNIAPGDQFVLRIKACNKNHNYNAPLNDFTYSLADCEYDTANGQYVKKEVYCNTFTIAAEDNGYYYCIFTINNNANGLTPQQFSAKNIRFFIETSGTRSPEYYLEDLQLFKYYETTGGKGYMPIDEQGETIETSTITTHYFVTENQLKVASSIDDLAPIEEQTIDYAIYQPFYCVGATKQRSVVAKESNYFNILQTIAETFEAWLEIVVNHTDDGEIISKMVRFKNYIGDNNYASFRYGVNLKGITRTNDSKAIVTKLIVKDNQNEHATNGFCSIKRAGSNITGENILYDFSYYANMGLLNALELERYLYIDGVVSADGLRRGYYNALRVLNDKLEQNNAQLIEKQKAKIALDAELELANSTRKTALESYEQMSAEFEEAFGFAPQDQNSSYTPALGERSDYQKYIKELSIYLIEKNAADNTIAIKGPQQETLASEISALEADNNNLIKEKARIHKDFYIKYYRFIQEGTWIKEDYTDDEKYYADAQSTLYNSCYPKVTYTIDVLEISQLPGYEYFNFDIGDMTYAEDEELFGEGRAEVVITEFVQNLDNPSKNTIKVQTYKNQFQDLFQKLTATSQQVQYNTGSYKKATSLADGNEALKQEFLLGSIEDVSQIIAGSSNTQSVTYDSRGIIVTDLASPMNQLRIVAGAIMLAQQDANGQQKWVTGLTPQGISASLIRAGQLDVGTIQIMAGNEPSFRWDAYGITAYDFSTAINNPTGFDRKKFVRFDRHGLYGADFTMPKEGLSVIDGSDWHPVTSTEVMKYANFALTWEGLKVTGSTGGTVRLGKQNGYIMLVNDGNKNTFSISESGEIETTGIKITSGKIGNENIASTNYADKVANDAQGAAIQEAERLTNILGNNLNTVSQNLQNQIKDCIKTDDLSIEETIDDATGIKTTTTTLNGVTTTTYTAPNDRYLLTNIGIAGNEEGTDRYFMVSTQGLLQATNAIISGKIMANEGYIAGWNIKRTETEKSITTGTLGSIDGFHMYATGGNDGADGSTERPYLFGSTSSQTWMLGIGSNFGVTNDGAIYAKKGKIGDLIIGDLASKQDISGRNLLLNTENSISNKEYNLANYTLTETPISGETYTISFFATPATDIQKILIFNSGAYQQLAEIILSDADKNNERFYQTTFKWNNEKDTSNNYIAIWMNDGDNVSPNDNASSIRKVKLEKGNKATYWTPAPEGQVSANVNSNDFSWKFSPTEGMYMWNGKQRDGSNDDPTRGAIFAIYNERNEDGSNHYKLSMRGSLTSTYLYAGEALKDNIIFKAGNSSAPVKSFKTRILMSSPKKDAQTTDNVYYTSTGKIPEGYKYIPETATVTPGWNISSVNETTGIITVSTSVPVGSLIPLTPVVHATIKEPVPRPYGLKINSDNNIYVPIYNKNSSEYEDIDLTTLIAQISSQF